MRRCKLIVGIAIASLFAIGGMVTVRIASRKHVRLELAKAREDMSGGLFHLARQRLSRLAAAHSGDAEVAYELGRSEAARGQFGPAMMSWSHIPADSPWAAPAALETASAAIALGRLALAERTLRNATIKPSPQLPALRHMLLVLLGQQGRFAEARGLIEDLWRGTTIIPASDVATRAVRVREHVGLDLEPFPLAWNLTQLGSGSAAADDADRKVLALARAHLATNNGDYAEAAAQLESCLGRWRDDPATWSGVRGSSCRSLPAGSSRLSRPSIIYRPARWTKRKSGT